MFQLEQTSLTAKILSTENITVVRGGNNPQFDLKKRTLYVPRWEIDDILDSMLVCHEVGHALHTPAQEWEDALTKDKLPHGCLNIVEDARSDKLFKQKYPGSVKVFNAAIRTKFFRERLFFYDKDTVNQKYNLFDRINIFYKNGRIFSGVVFNDAERVFIERIDAATTFKEVVEITKDLIQFIKDVLKEQNKEQTDEKGDGAGDGPSDQNPEKSEGKGNPESGSEKKEGTPETGEGEGEDEAGEMTGSDEEQTGDSREEQDDEAGNMTGKMTGSDEDKNGEELEEAISPVTSNMISGNLKHVVIDKYASRGDEVLSDNYSESKIIKSYKEILADFPDLDRYYYYVSIKEIFQREVAFLSQQFEMRKSAKKYEARRVAKTGMIDMKKLASYQVRNDVFKKKMVVERGKNHGMIMLLDWSGSMNGIMPAVIRQVYMLVTFCKKVNIPFVVYGFRDTSFDKSGYSINNNGVNKFELLELFSSTMREIEFAKMCELLITNNIIKKSIYSRTGTPLGYAIGAMRVVAGAFKNKYNIDKLSFITLTDGEDNKLDLQRITNLIDPVTRKKYATNLNRVDCINSLYQMVKDRFDTTNVTFFATQYFGKKSLRSGMYWSGVGLRLIRNTLTTTKYLKDRFVEVNNHAGRDKILVFDSRLMYRYKDPKQITHKLTASKIANIMKEEADSFKKTRLLLEKFIEVIS